jgi:hypothetical protein
MKWTLLILALGGLLAVTLAADVLSIRHLFGLPVLEPVHYLGRDDYDLSAIRRQQPARHRTAPHLRNDRRDPP